MDSRIVALTQNLAKRPAASSSAIRDILVALSFDPPNDYIDFLLYSNGAEGFLPNGAYLIIYSIEQLLPCNEPYGLGGTGPGFVIFGSDGGGMSYAFDIRQSPVNIVKVDPICMDLGQIIFCGCSFQEFLNNINNE